MNPDSGIDDRASGHDPSGYKKRFAEFFQDRVFNDPSAGSPTETLLRLLLPLNDKV